MADRTPGGKPVDDAARLLKRRRIELELKVLETDIMRNEVDIMQFDAEIARRREVIAGIQQRVTELLVLLTEPGPP